MDLRMFVAIAQKGNGERQALLHPVEATPGGQIFFGQVRSQRDEVSVRLLRFRQDR
jgi:hypothetical protein